jgi:hypothetical protein
LDAVEVDVVPTGTVCHEEVVLACSGVREREDGGREEGVDAPEAETEGAADGLREAGRDAKRLEAVEAKILHGVNSCGVMRGITERATGRAYCI